MSEDHNDHALGPRIEARAAPRPERVTLKGRAVTLVPLSPEHAAPLYAASHGPGRDQLWTYLFNGPFDSLEAFTADVEAKAKAADPLYFAVLDNRDGRPVGYQSLMRIDPANRVIEVGGIMYTPLLQAIAASTEAQFLFARYVFDELGYRRYEWKCNDRNAPSRRAALRLGFAFEGVFRQHMIVKSRSRDTAWFSMLDREWPARRAAFEGWLDAENFDAQGRQKRRLQDFAPAAP
ncbi:MAG: GNAT family N-acetyltransferase [Pseudomonadota bacterium]|nr:GNAT family N-acetyltransferase [Pseudomonadota bacterium]